MFCSICRRLAVISMSVYSHPINHFHIPILTPYTTSIIQHGRILRRCGSIHTSYRRANGHRYCSNRQSALGVSLKNDMLYSYLCLLCSRIGYCCNRVFNIVWIEQQSADVFRLGNKANVCSFFNTFCEKRFRARFAVRTGCNFDSNNMRWFIRETRVDLAWIGKFNVR